MNIKVPEKYEISSSAKKFCLLLIAIGVGTFILTLTQDPKRAWVSFLHQYFYWLNIGLAGIFFAALQHITGSYWSASVRRIAENFSAYIPVSLVLFGVLLFAIIFPPVINGKAFYLFEWTNSAWAHEGHNHGKSAYLNLPFFIFRHLFLYALCFILGRWIIQNSYRQDEGPNPYLTRLNVKLSGAFILLFAVTYTTNAVDLMMSLDPHWFSTIFGVYCWAGLFYSGLAMLNFWAIKLKKKGILENFVNEHHLHDIGKLMFAFCVFWGYVGFSQYMLIWYANLPEETTYMILRTQGHYQYLGLTLMLAKFLIPFFLIISRFAKRSLLFMKFMCVWFLVAQWIDVYWMVYPHFYPTQTAFGWNEIGLTLGFIGLFFLSVGMRFKKVSPVAINDPWLPDALHHHQ